MDQTASSRAQISHYEQTNVDILKTQQKYTLPGESFPTLGYLIDPRVMKMIGFCSCLDSLSVKVQAEQNHIIARQLQCNKCLIGLFTLVHAASDVTFRTTAVCDYLFHFFFFFSLRSPLQLWSELRPRALGIIRQPLQWRGRSKVTLVTNLLREA